MAELILSCEHKGCAFTRRTATGVELPSYCPSCGRYARWRVERAPLQFSYNDVQLLRQLRIAPD